MFISSEKKYLMGGDMSWARCIGFLILVNDFIQYWSPQINIFFFVW